MSDPHDSNVQFTRYQIKGLEPLSTYCEEDPQVCCAGTPGCGGVVAEPGNTQPIIGWCVEYTQIQVPASAVGELMEYCVLDPTDCCPGSSSSSGSASANMNDDGQGIAGSGGTIVGLNVQKTIVNLPPGSVILGKYCVFNPVECCPEQASSSSGSHQFPSGSGSTNPVDNCLIQDCTGCEPIPSRCDGTFMSSQINLSWSGVLNVSGSSCVNCVLNDLPPFNSAMLTQASGVCEWVGGLVLECNNGAYPVTSIELFYNAGTLVDGECTSPYPLGYWILVFTDVTPGIVPPSTYSVVWAIADADWSCNDVNFFGPENLVSQLGAPCDWSQATVVATPAFDCGGSSSASSSSSSSSASASSSSSSSSSAVPTPRVCTCSECPSGTAFQWQVDVSGVGPGTCPQCDGFNGLFTLTNGLDVDGNVNNCSWVSLDELTECVGTGPATHIYRVNATIIGGTMGLGFYRKDTFAASYSGTFNDPDRCTGPVTVTLVPASVQDCSTWPATLTLIPVGGSIDPTPC